MYRPTPRNRQINIFHGTEAELKLTFDGEVYGKTKNSKVRASGYNPQDFYHRFYYYPIGDAFIWVRSFGLGSSSMTALNLTQEFTYSQNFWGARRDVAKSKAPQRERIKPPPVDPDPWVEPDPAPIRSYKDD